MWGKILWIRLGSGELRPLTFCWPGLSHMVTPPARKARKGGQTLCLRGRGYGFHDYMTTSAILSSRPQNHDSLSQEERMNIEGQLVVSVLEGKTMIRKLQPKIVFIPNHLSSVPASVPTFGNWVSGTVEGLHYACFLIQGMFLTSL